MRLIIAGSRNLKLNWPVQFLQSLLDQFQINPTKIVSGKAKGVDTFGEMLADFEGWPVKPFPVTKYDWIASGKSAGPIRNRKMAGYADALLLIWDGESAGSANMKKQMLERGKPVYEVILKVHSPWIEEI